MGIPISNVNWIEKNEVLDDLLHHESTLTIHPMDQGFEAEVIKINSEKESFVLKIWNKSSNPDVRFQYHLLNVLFEKGLSVSKPVAWGVNPDSEKVMLTTFDGMPIRKVNKKKMTEIANILSNLHQMPLIDIGDIHLPKFDFVSYVFPGLSEHSDLHNAIQSLVRLIEIKQENVIHGDFHLGNIVEEDDQLTILDWTNGQLGDARYDFAWSLTLKKIYISERHALFFRSAYLMKNDIREKELEVFEALACIRWILLYRNGGVPKGPNTIDRVKSLINNNSFLHEMDANNFVI